MANNKQRYINTRFWNDGFISELDPIEKLLFIYLLTNEHTNISGVYELPLKIMAVETGIEVNMLKKILPRLKDKIGYIGGMVVVKNFLKHQETGSEFIKRGVINCLQELDKDFLLEIVNKGYYRLDKYYMDTLSIPYTGVLSYSNSNLDSNSISTSLREGAVKKKLKMKNSWNKQGEDYLEEDVDADTGESIVKKEPKRIQAINYIKDYFTSKCKEVTGITPVLTHKQNIIIANLYKKGFKPSELIKIIDWWFDNEQDIRKSVHINMCLSSYNITNFRVYEGK